MKRRRVFVTAKANQLNAIFLPSGVHQFSNYSLPKNFWFGHVFVNVQYNIDRDQKKSVSTIFIRNLEIKSPRSCVRVRFYIQKYTILAETREARVNTETRKSKGGEGGLNQCPSVKSSNTSIKAEQTDLHHICIRSVVENNCFAFINFNCYIYFLCHFLGGGAGMGGQANTKLNFFLSLCF